MHRTLIATVLAGFLGATAPSGLLDRLWDLISVFWSDSATADAGLGWDSDGGASPIQNTQARVGCTFDPNGRCLPQP